jgi:hypothetical protein
MISRTGMAFLFGFFVCLWPMMYAFDGNITYGLFMGVLGLLMVLFINHLEGNKSC